MESYLLYSSLTLLIMGCLALALSILFRLKFKALNSLPKNLSATIFNKTFVVFYPYSEQKKMIHNFLSVLPIAIGFASLGIALAFLLILEAGFILSFFITIIGLNIIGLEDAPEVYKYSKIFIEAVQNETKLGTGDLRVFQTIKKMTPRLSNYYFGLSIIFIAFSAILPSIWSSLLWFFAQFIGLILQFSLLAGDIAWILAVFLFAIPVVIIQILFSEIKRKLLGYTIESPSALEQYIIDHHGYVEHVEPKSKEE